MRIKKKLLRNSLVFTIIFSLLCSSYLPFFQTLFSPQEVRAQGSSCSIGSASSNLTPRYGGVALDQAASFLANMNDITGAYYDENLDRIVFVGKTNTTLPEFDKDDLATAIRAVMFEKVNPAISIEEGVVENDGIQEVFYYGGIKNTKFGKVLFDADMALKRFVLGFDEDDNRISTSVSGYKSIIERYLDKNPSPGQDAMGRTWITPKDITLKKDDTTDSFVFDSVQMEVNFEARSLDNDPLYNQAGEEFATHHTQNFDAFAEEISAYKDTKKLAKIVSVVKWLSDNGIATDFHWAYDYAPKYVETPTQVTDLETYVPSYNGYSYTTRGGVQYYDPNDYIADDGSASNLKAASEAVDAPKEEIHWTFTQNGQQYESVAVAADAFRSLGSYNTTTKDLSLDIAGDLDLVFQRSYSSFSGGQFGIGRGWSFMPATLVDNIPVAGDFLNGTCTNDTYKKRYKLAFSANGQRETFTGACSTGGLAAYFPDEPYFHSQITTNKINDYVTEYIVTLKDQNKYVFEELWGTDERVDLTSYNFRLDRLEDKNGNKINYNYESSDSAKLVSISDDNNHAIDINYSTVNGQELITSIEDWDNRTVSFTYDDQGNLLTVTDPRNNITTYTYDSNNRLTSIEDREENTIVSNTYTPEAKLATQTDAANVTKTFSYNNDNRVITATTSASPSRITSIKYDERARILEDTDALNKKFVYTYATESAPLTVTDKNSNTTTNSYDINGNVTSVTYPDNSIVEYEYNNKNFVTKITDRRYGINPKITTFGYDNFGNLLVATEAGVTKKFTYNSNGELLTKTDPLNHVTTWTRDAFGNPLTETNPLGKTSTFTYDTLGRLTKITDPNGKEVAYTYDNNGNRLTISNSIGTMSYQYDKENRLKKTTLPDNSYTNFSYNASGSLTSVTDALNNTTTYAYDNYQNLVSKQNALNKTTEYEYDKLNRQIRRETPLGKAIEWEHDGNGNITKRTDENYQDTNYQYDVLNRLKKITYPDSSQITFAHDDRGNIIAATSSAGTTIYQYDVLNRLHSVTDTNNATVTYNYDDASNLSSIVYPNNETVSYEYDDNNRLIQVIDWNGQVTEYRYNDNGTLAEREYPNGIITKYFYDNAKNLIDIRHYQRETPIAQFAYTRNSLGNIIEASESGILSNLIVNADPPPPDVDDFTIYDETLAQNWEDWSWDSTNNFADTSSPYSGTKNISWTANNGWGGFKLFNQSGGINTTGYKNLTFALKASQAGQLVQVQALDTNHQLLGDPVWLGNYGGEPVTGSYKLYTIPLDHLQANDRQIGGFYINDRTGTSQPPMYIDKIELTTTPNLTKFSIYQDELPGLWGDWSWWSTNNLASTTYPHSGTTSISWEVTTGYGGLKLFNDSAGVNTTNYNNLTFALRASQAGQKVQVHFIDDAHSTIGQPVLLGNYGGDPVAGSYKVYTIPLDDLSAVNRQINGVVFQDITGTAQPPMYVDDVSLTATTTASMRPIYTEDLPNGWGDWSWNSTNNLSNTSSPYEGTKGISWVANAGWAIFKLYSPTNPINTTGYSNLTFALKSTQSGQAVQVQLFDSGHSLIGSPVLLDNYGGDAISGSYKQYNIPLLDLGGSNKDIYGIMIQDITGTSQPAMYIDSIGFTRAPAATPLTDVKAEYWNSGSGAAPSMPTGAPDLTRTDSEINFDWGTGSPDPSINDDHFIARWTKTANFQPGWYKFSVTTDDGFKLYIDDQLVMDEWQDQPKTTYYKFTQLTQGTHKIVMQYYENSGSAVAKLNYLRYNEPASSHNLFAYDALQRLTTATYSASMSTQKTLNYTYDDVGNRLTDVLNGSSTTSTYNNDNQITAKGTASFTYDDKGNQITRTIQGNTKTLAYDFDNRLLSVTDSVSSTSSEFVYDAVGNRVSEKFNNTPVMQYVNDVSGELAYTLEAKDLTSNESTYYIYGLGLVSQGDGTNENTKYFLEDGVGNIRYVVDRSGGELQAYEYDPDGNEFLGGPAADFRFKGEHLDPSTDLYFMRARYYDPFTGRFISRDPVENGDITNPRTDHSYAYTLNNPINFSDPTGLWTVDIGLSLAIPGAGIVAGYQISDTGIYRYEGAGMSYPGGPGLSIMYSDSNPTPGISSQYSVGAFYGVQGTMDLYGNKTAAQGFTTPGLAAYTVNTIPYICWR